MIVKILKEFWKLLLAGGIILAALLAMHFYQMKCITHLTESTMVITDDRVSRNLKSGAGEESEILEFMEVEAFEPVYMRMNSMYVGSGKVATDSALPFYTNGGSAVVFMLGNATLYTNQFEELPTFTNMYLSDGFIYNYDKTQADEDEFLFAKLSNGLVINARQMTIEIPGKTYILPLNSIIYMDETNFRYYSNNGGELTYGSLPTTSMAQVTISDQTMSIEALMYSLGIISPKGNTPAINPNAGEEGEAGQTVIAQTGTVVSQRGDSASDSLEDDEDAGEEGNGGEASGPKDKNGTSELLESENEEEDNSEGNQNGSEDGESLGSGEIEGSGGSAGGSGGSSGGSAGDDGSDGGDEDGGTDGDTKDDSTLEPDDGSDGGNDGGNGGAGSGGSSGDSSDDSGDPASGVTGSGTNNNLGETGEKTDSNVGNGDGTMTDGTEVDLPFVVPTATLSNLSTDIYSLSGELSVNDPSYALKRIALELYWRSTDEDGNPIGNPNNPDDYKLMYRRTYKSACTFSIDNLPPNTTIYIKAHLTYYKKGSVETETYTCYDNFSQRLTTKSMDTMDPIYVEFDESIGTEERYLQNQIRIHNLKLSGPNKNVLNKISRAVISVKTYDRNDGSSQPAETGSSRSLVLNYSALNRNYIYKTNTYVSDQKQYSILSNSRVEYEISFYDSFGNRLTNIHRGYEPNTVADGVTSLQVCGGEVGKYTPTGTTYTRKTMPMMEVSTMPVADQEDAIQQLNFQIGLVDSNAAMSGTELKLRLYEGKASEGGNYQEAIISLADLQAGNKIDQSFKGLIAGHTYQLLITGNYKLDDNGPEQKDQQLIVVEASTVALSSFGRVNYILKASHVNTGTEQNPTQYESATAQKVTANINYRTTKRELVNNYVEYIQVDLSESSIGASVMSAIMYKDHLKNLKIIEDDVATGNLMYATYTLSELFQTADGKESFEWNYPDLKEPTVQISYSDTFTGESNFWELFTGAQAAEITFDFGEGSLKSNTAYQLYLTTFAEQREKYHDVSGRTNSTRRSQFTTLRQMPFLEYKDVLVYSSQLNFYEMFFNDPDKSIFGGKITVSGGVETQTYALDYDKDQGGFLQEVKMDDLRIGATYTITITADQIRRSSGTSYRYSNVELLSYTFVAGDGISGTLTLEQLAYGLTQFPGSNKLYLRDDFDLYDGSYEFGYLSSSAALTSDTSWRTTDYLPVEEGKTYYLDRVRSANSSVAYLAFFDENKEALSGGRIYVYNGSFVEAPEGAAYVRYSTADTYVGEYTVLIGGFYEMELDTDVSMIERLDEGYNTTSKTYSIGADGDIKIEQGESKSLVAVTDYGVRKTSSSAHTYTFYNGSTQISKTTPYRNVAVDIPANATSVTISGSYKAKVCVVDNARLDWLNSATLSNMQSIIRVDVKDSNGNLFGSAVPHYTVTLTEDKDTKPTGLASSSRELLYDTDKKNGTDTEKISFESNAGCSYKMVLETTYRGETLILDTLTFEADRPKYVIESEKDFYKVARYKEADFIVTKDITMTEDRIITQSDTYPFNGTIDFQDHKLSIKYSSSSKRLFRTLGSAAVLENLQFNPTLDATTKRQQISSTFGLAYANYGVVRNIIVNLNLGTGYYQKNTCAGLFYQNFGTIENFALYYAANSNNYVGNYFGGLTVYNYGPIRNGVVYSKLWLQAISGVYQGDEKSSNTTYVGGLVAQNTTGGRISNVYSVMNLGVERDSRTTTSSDGTKNINLTTNGLLVGYCAGGSISNCFTYGDIYEMYWKQAQAGNWGRDSKIYEKYNPLGSGGYTSLLKNTVYFTSQGMYKQSVGGRVEDGTFLQRLSDETFYNSNVNSDKQFQMTDIKSGFYPRVYMSEGLMNLQERINLPPTSTLAQIEFGGAAVEEQGVDESGNDYAILLLNFVNSRGYTIENVKFEGLDVTAVDGGEDYEQYIEGKYYYVRVRVTPKDRYRDTYVLKSYGLSLGSVQTEVTNVDRSLALTFYEKVTQENWLTAFNDLEGNYQIAGDIDFSKFEGEDRKAAHKVLEKASSSTPFKGKIDGLKQDSDTYETYVIKGMTFSNVPTDEVVTGNLTWINYLDGASIKNLTFEDVTINNNNGNTTAHTAIFGNSQKQTEYSGIYVKNLTINNPYTYAGVISYIYNSSLTDVAVQGMTVKASGSASSLRVGGIVGYLGYSNLENCYAAGINFEVDSSQATVTGIGGISGEASPQSNTTEVYAQGRISTITGCVGGIVGYNNGTLSRCWAKVNTSGSGVAGGIAGRLLSSSRVSQMLSIGNISGLNSNTGRIVGNIVSEGTKLTNAYAFSGQKINSAVNAEDPMEATGLLTAEQLADETNYWYYLNLGYGFDYTPTKNGALPLLFSNARPTELLPFQSNIDVALTGSVSLKVLKTDDTPKAEYHRDTSKYEIDFTVELTVPGLSLADYQDAVNGINRDKFNALLADVLNNIQISGIEFKWNLSKTEVPWDTDHLKWAGDGSKTLQLRFTMNNAEGIKDNIFISVYKDSYQVLYTYTDASGVVWELDDALDFGEPLYLYISSVKNNDIENPEEDLSTWYGAMKQLGTTYQNFRIVNDLNFTEGADKFAPEDFMDPQLMNLNISRLEGYGFEEPEDMGTEHDIRAYLLGEDESKVGKKVKIENLNMIAHTAGSSIFNTVQGTVQGISFENTGFSNVNGSSVFGGSYIGIIGKNNGIIRFVDFTDMNLKAARASSYVGAIAYNSGSIEYVRVKDAQVSNENSRKYNTDYVGGMVGYSIMPITHCSVLGTTAPTDTDPGSFLVEVTSKSTSDYSDYTGGLVGYSTTYVRYCYADQVKVMGSYRTGAIAGYCHQVYGIKSGYADTDIRYNDIFYYIQVTDSVIEGNRETGGAYGYGYASERTYCKGNKVIQRSDESYRAGGITGIDTDYGISYSYVEDCEIITNGCVAGGIFGYGYYANYCTVVNTTITARGRIAGGIAGSIYQYYIVGCEVEDCTIETEQYAGGLSGYAAQHSSSGQYYSYANLVTATEITATEYVGGAVGASYGKCYQSNVIDDSVVVNGTTNVGGYFGLASGGVHYRNIGGATVNGATNVGGYAGTIVGYSQKVQSLAGTGLLSSLGSNIQMYNPQTKIYDTVITGTVSASNYNVGGLAGLFDPGSRPIDPETGVELDDKDTGYKPYVSQDYYYSILIAPYAINLTSNYPDYLQITYNNDQDVNDSGVADSGIGYLRIYRSIKSNKFNDSEMLQKIKILTENREITSANASSPIKPYMVGNDVLASGWFYNNTESKGGMDLNGGSADRYFDTKHMKTEGALEANLFPLMNSYAYPYYSVHAYADNAVNGVDYHYIQRIFGYTNGGVDNIKFGYKVQDGIRLPHAAIAAAEIGVSYMYSDAMIAAETDTLAIYPSSVHTLNIDIPETLCNQGLTYRIENVKGEVTASGAIDDILFKGATQRVRTLTVEYDFASYLTLSIMKDGEIVGQEVHAIDPASLSRTLSSSGDDQYYISSEGVVSLNKLLSSMKAGQEKDVENTTYESSEFVSQSFAAQGSFGHIYGSLGLTGGGKIVDLTTGNTVGAVDHSKVGTAVAVAKPAYESKTKDGSLIETYSDYSLVTAGTASATRSYRMFDKAGEVYAVEVDKAREDGVRLHDMIADTYNNGQNSYQYISYLTKDGWVKDTQQPLKWPEDLDNAGIGEIGGNIAGNAPVIVMRYTDNTVAAFQYMTGTMLMIDTGEKRDVNFVEYATIWLMDLGNLFYSADNTSYLAAVDLTSSLAAEPVDTSLALNVTGNSNLVSTESMEGAVGASRVTSGAAMIEGVLNEAAANWTEEALNSKDPVSTLFLEIGENAVMTAAMSDQKLIEKTFGENKGKIGTNELQITEENISEFEEVLEDIFENEETVSSLTSVLTEGGYSEAEAESLVEAYYESISTAAVTVSKGQYVSGEAAAAGETAGAGEGTGFGEGTGTGEGLGAAEEAMVPDDYVITVDSDDESYAVYKESELLNAALEESALMSENQKIRVLKQNGLYSNPGINLDDLKLTAEQNKQGIVLLAGSGVAIAVLLTVMYRKRKRMMN